MLNQSNPENESSQIIARGLLAPPEHGKVSTLFICALGDVRSQKAAALDPDAAYLIGGLNGLKGIREIALFSNRVGKRMSESLENIVKLINISRKVVIFVTDVTAQDSTIQWIKEVHPNCEVRIASDPYMTSLAAKKKFPSLVERLQRFTD
jgi:hypothetical protein